MREGLYSKLDEGKNIRKVAELFPTFLTTPDGVEKNTELADKTEYITIHTYF